MLFNHFKTKLENLPDEIILDICRYLHCSHVLYAFYYLNSRLNRTIASYRQNVWFRRATHSQLIYMYKYILPCIGSSVLSLTMHPLHQASFSVTFKDEMPHLFPNLKTLTLTSWNSDSLLLFLMGAIRNMRYLKKLIIQELSCLSKLVDNFIDNILNINKYTLDSITFDYDCDSLQFSDGTLTNFTPSSIRYLTIQLNKISDLSYLIKLIPNVYHLDVTFRNSPLEKVEFDATLPNLKEFSVWSIYWYSNFDGLTTLLPIAPSIEVFSLTLSTRDPNLIDGVKIKSVLPPQLTHFNYTVCYYANENIEHYDVNSIKQSWRTTPVICSVSELDKRIFLHTVPYTCSRLTIRSNIAKNMATTNSDETYSQVDQVQVYMLKSISDAFPIIAQCRRVREITLLSASNLIPVSNVSSTDNKMPLVKLPCLNRLDILTIEGIPSEIHHLKELLIAARNLSVLVIDLDCLLQILDDENQPLILYVLLQRNILDLCIRLNDLSVENSERIYSDKITCAHIYRISRIFTHVRNLTIDYETSNEYIEPNIIKKIINRFERLVILHIYGKIPGDMIEKDIRQWFIEQNISRIKPTDIFRIESSNDSFKLWL